MFSIPRKQNLEFLTIPDLTLRNIGIDISTCNKKPLIKNLWRFLFLSICVIYLQFSLINFVIYCGVARLDAASTSLSILNQGCLILTKASLFLLKKDKFMKLIWDINLLAREANTQQHKKWLSENWLGRLIGKGYFYVGWTTVICSMLFPLAHTAYDYSQSSDFIHYFPFGGKFPYDNGHILFYILNYFLSCCYAYALLHMSVSIDSLFGWYICGISGHFRMLRCQVENLGAKLQTGDRSNFSQEFGKIVQYHNRALGFVDDLNGIYGVILLAEILLSCLQMCFLIYISTAEQDPFNIPYNYMFFIIILFQLIIYCFGGEKIKDESLMLCHDFYLKFPWHSMSTKEKKIMLLPLMRSQKVCILTATFFELDRNLLVYIFRTAFSFNAFLSAMKE